MLKVTRRTREVDIILNQQTAEDIARLGDALAEETTREQVTEAGTNRQAKATAKRIISIHALHEESDSAAGHFCPLFETQASCLALSISNNTADTTNNMSKTSNWLSVSF